jgi:hypothetical protein
LIDGPSSGQGQDQIRLELPRRLELSEAQVAQVRHWSIVHACYYLGIIRYVIFNLKANQEDFASCVQIKQVMSSMD